MIFTLQGSSKAEDIATYLDALRSLFLTGPRGEKVVDLLFSCITLDELLHLCSHSDARVQMTAYSLVSSFADGDVANLPQFRYEDAEAGDAFFERQTERAVQTFSLGIVKRMMGSLRKYPNNPGLSSSVASLFCSLSVEVSIISDLYNVYGHAVIKLLLKSTEAATLKFLFVACRNVLQFSSVRIAFEKDGLLKPLLAKIRAFIAQWQDNTGMYEQCLHIVALLCDEKSIFPDIMESGIMDAVGNAFQKFPSEETRLTALRCLALGGGSESHMETMSSRVGAEGFYQLLSQQQVQYTLPAASLLAKVTDPAYYASARFSESFCELDGIRALWEIIDRDRDDFGLLLSCVACIANISDTVSCQKSVMSVVPPKFFVDLLLRPESSLRLLGTRALRSLSQGEAELKTLIVENGIPAICEYQEKLDEGMNEHATAVIRNIVDDPALIDSAIEKGGLEILQRSLFRKSQVTASCALESFAIITSRSDLQSLIVGDSFGQIVEWSLTPRLSVRLPAVQTLANCLLNDSSFSIFGETCHPNVDCFLRGEVLEKLLQFFSHDMHESVAVQESRILACLSLSPNFAATAIENNLIPELCLFLQQASTVNSTLLFNIGLSLGRILRAVAKPILENPYSTQTAKEKEMLKELQEDRADEALFSLFSTCNDSSLTFFALQAAFSTIQISDLALDRFLKAQGLEFLIDALNSEFKGMETLCVEVLRYISSVASDERRRIMMRTWGEKRFVNWIVRTRSRPFAWRAYDIFIDFCELVKWHLSASIDFLFSLLNDREQLKINSTLFSTQQSLSSSPRSASSPSPFTISGSHSSPGDFTPSPAVNDGTQPGTSTNMTFATSSSAQSPGASTPGSETPVQREARPVDAAKLRCTVVRYLHIFVQKDLGLERFRVPTHISSLGNFLLTSKEEEGKFYVVDMLRLLSKHEQFHEELLTSFSQNALIIASVIRNPMRTHRSFGFFLLNIISNSDVAVKVCSPYIVRCLLDLAMVCLRDLDEEQAAEQCISSLTRLCKGENGEEALSQVDMLFTVLAQLTHEFLHIEDFFEAVVEFFYAAFLKRNLREKAHKEGAALFVLRLAQRRPEIRKMPVRATLLETVYQLWLPLQFRSLFYGRHPPVQLGSLTLPDFSVTDTIWNYEKHGHLRERCVACRILGEMSSPSEEVITRGAHEFDAAVAAVPPDKVFRACFELATGNERSGIPREPGRDASFQWEGIRSAFRVIQKSAEQCASLQETRLLMYICFNADRDTLFWAIKLTEAMLGKSAFIEHCRDVLLFSGMFSCSLSQSEVLQTVGRLALLATPADSHIWIQRQVLNYGKLLKKNDEQLVSHLLQALPHMCKKLSLHPFVGRSHIFMFLEEKKQALSSPSLQAIAVALARISSQGKLVDSIVSDNGIFLLRYVVDHCETEESRISVIRVLYDLCHHGDIGTHLQIIRLQFISWLSIQFRTFAEAEPRKQILQIWASLCRYTECITQCSEVSFLHGTFAEYVCSSPDVPVRHMTLISEMYEKLAYFPELYSGLLTGTSMQALKSFLTHKAADSKESILSALCTVASEAESHRFLCSDEQFISIIIEKLTVPTESHAHVLEIIGHLTWKSPHTLKSLLNRNVLHSLMLLISSPEPQIRYAAAKPLASVCEVAPHDVFMRGGAHELCRVLAGGVADDQPSVIFHAARGIAALCRKLPVVIPIFIKQNVLAMCTHILKRHFKSLDTWREALQIVLFLIKEDNGVLEEFFQAEGPSLVLRCMPDILDQAPAGNAPAADSLIMSYFRASHTREAWYKHRHLIKYAWAKEKLVGYYKQIPNENATEPPKLFKPRSLSDYMNLDADAGIVEFDPETVEQEAQRLKKEKLRAWRAKYKEVTKLQRPSKEIGKDQENGRSNSNANVHCASGISDEEKEDIPTYMRVILRVLDDRWISTPIYESSLFESPQTVPTVRETGDEQWFVEPDPDLYSIFASTTDIVEHICSKKERARLSFSTDKRVHDFLCWVFRNCGGIDTLTSAAKCVAHITENEEAVLHYIDGGCLEPLCVCVNLSIYFEAFPTEKRLPELFLALQRASVKALANILVEERGRDLVVEDDVFGLELLTFTSKDKVVSTYASIGLANYRMDSIYLRTSLAVRRRKLSTRTGVPVLVSTDSFCSDVDARSPRSQPSSQLEHTLDGDRTWMANQEAVHESRHEKQDLVTDILPPISSSPPHEQPPNDFIRHWSEELRHHRTSPTDV
eukprot:ANDGO_07084.mRNA.1 hypothetical protein